MLDRIVTLRMFQRSASEGKEAWRHMFVKQICGRCKLMGSLDPGLEQGHLEQDA